LGQLISRGHATPALRRQFAELIGRRDPQAAIEALATDAADDRLTRLRLARLCARAERLAEAEAHYASVLSAAPQDPAPWVEAGRLAMRLGLSETAAARLGQALRWPGDHHDEARTALAATRMHAGLFAQAGRQWWRLTRSRRASSAGWAGLLVCAHLTGRDALVRRAEAYLRSHTSPAERRRMLASLWRDAAGPAAMQQALRLPKQPASPRRVLAGMVRDAAHVLAHQAEATPGRADVHYHHAVLEAARGDRTTAQLAVSRALAINPRYADARRFAEQHATPLRLVA
jgi:tetratricopeptide (TPR) repeat protein